MGVFLGMGDGLPGESEDKMTDTSVSVRTEAEEEGTIAIRVDTHLRHGVTIWADGEVDRVTITAPDVDGHGRMTILADTPQLREALRALVRVWDAEDEAARS